MHNFTFPFNTKIITMEKIKLMCSYGGRIHHRPHDLQLSYFGGHTKILTVNRNINFSNLLSKLQDLADCNFQIQIKYKLPCGQHLEPLISVFDDDDVDHMMFEYDLLRRVSVTPARFRLFLFFPATAKPMAAAAWSLNPDFLFGFDKEYSPVEPLEICENPDVVPGNVIIGDEAPNYNSINSYVYPMSLGYRLHTLHSHTMNEPKYAYPYPPPQGGGGYYQGPPVMAPPQYQYAAAPPPRREPGFLEGCLAALCCCCLLDECCCDPTIIFY
ncbi:hypothetical protein L6452_44234 [Arctium lappa]|uniref:Uncharacterized protein n=1 Tax=Arctium lappa TaxID=4217 RepID=A0ACB8XJ47_ARCLA|nr:hypothetical protein L6452_44234 [Arctium lappa]